MKKVFSLIAFALISMGANAQVFSDGDGNEIASGSTLTMSNAVYDEDEECIEVNLTDLYVYNNTSSSADISVNVKNESMPSGDFQCCFGSNCRVIKEGKSVDFNISLLAEEMVEINSTEWAVSEGEYGTCKMVFTLSNGNYVNVNFVYADPAGIKDINANTNVNANNYNLAGQRVNANAKGLVISCGKKVIK